MRALRSEVPSNTPDEPRRHTTRIRGTAFPGFEYSMPGTISTARETTLNLVSNHETQSLHTSHGCLEKQKSSIDRECIFEVSPCVPCSFLIGFGPGELDPATRSEHHIAQSVPRRT